MLIISGVTINKLNKSQITSSTNIITGYSKNIVKDTDEGVKNVNNGQWGNVITSKGIEKPVGERQNNIGGSNEGKYCMEHK